MSPFISDDAVRELEYARQKTAKDGLKILLKKFGMNPDSVSLEFDPSLDLAFRITMNEDYTHATIHTPVFAMDMQAFAIMIRNAIETIQRMPKLKSKSLEHWETSPARAQLFSSLLENHRARLLKPSEYSKTVVHTVILTHAKSGESVSISSDEVDTFQLTNEAHISLSRKVFGG